MRSEIAEIPDVLQRQIDQGLSHYWALGETLRDARLKGFVTCARGTSDQAAMFFKYLFEIHCGLPVASIGPSVGSLYKAKLQLDDFACMTFSQSGGSPDLLALQTAARQGGARTVAFLNQTDSAIGKDAMTVMPILAGPEMAVAATKSYVGMLFASLGVLAGYQQDDALNAAMSKLPEMARKAVDSDWLEAIVPLARAQSVFCIGRGPGLAVAGEAALKLKETCLMHAEAYSSAEVLHGPIAAASGRFAVLLFDAKGDAQQSIDVAEQKLRAKGATVFRVSATNGLRQAQGEADCHPLLEPLLQAVTFYSFVESLSVQLGLNPDAPVGLQKVTMTV